MLAISTLCRADFDFIIRSIHNGRTKCWYSQDRKIDLLFVIHLSGIACTKPSTWSLLLWTVFNRRIVWLAWGRWSFSSLEVRPQYDSRTNCNRRSNRSPNPILSSLPSLPKLSCCLYTSQIRYEIRRIIHFLWASNIYIE